MANSATDAACVPKRAFADQDADSDTALTTQLPAAQSAEVAADVPHAVDDAPGISDFGLSPADVPHAVDDAPQTADRSQPGPERTSRLSRAAVQLYSFSRVAILAVFALVAVATTAAAIVCATTGITPVVIVSDSMEPTFSQGSLVFSRTVPASQAQAGDIITVERPNDMGAVTHRVISARQLEGDSYEFVMKGDANTELDQEPYVADTVGQHVASLPYLGYAAVFFQRFGIPVGAVALAALIFLILFDPSRKSRRARKA